MGRRIQKISSITLLIMIIMLLFFTCASPHHTSDEGYKNFRVKRIEDQQGKRIISFGTLQTVSLDSYPKEDFSPLPVFNDFILFLCSNTMIYFIVLSILHTLIMSYRYIKMRNIQVSQVKSKLFMVHYLQLKDGKKNALSFRYSF